MSYEDEPLVTPAFERSAAAARVSAPSILLIIVGILNFLGVAYAAFNLVVAAITPADQLAAQQEVMMRAFTKGVGQDKGKDFGAQPKQDPEQVKSLGIIFNIGWLAVLLAVSIVPLIAGIRMRNLRGYGLAMTGAVLALFPCLDPGCCFIIGPVAGIWALVVLSSADVKAAFH